MGIFYPIGYYETFSFISCLAASFPLFLVVGFAIAKSMNYKFETSASAKNLLMNLSQYRINCISNWFAIILIPYLIFLSFEFIKLLGTVDPEIVRSMIYSDESPYYTNKYFEYIISCYVKPMILSMVWLSVFFYISEIKFIRFLILTVISVFVVTTVEMGRFGFYVVLQCLLLLLLEGKLAFFKHKMIWLFVLLPIVVVTYFRSAYDEDLLELIWRVYILTYHTLFIGILNHDYANYTITNGYFTLGMSTIFSIFDPIVVAIKSTGLIDYVPESGVLGKDLDYIRNLGIDVNGNLIYGNAFGSIIYGMYRDFGLFGPPLFAIIFGMMLTKPANLSYWTIPLHYLLFFGIFQPILTFPFIMSLIIYKLVLSYVRNGVCKYNL